MILPWMISAVVYAACITLAAYAAEPFARTLRHPVRGIWAVAIVAATTWPVLSWVAGLAIPSLHSPVGDLSAVRVLPDVSSLAARSSPLVFAGVQRIATLLWLTASLLLAIRLARSVIAARRVRDVAEPRVVDGMSVLVTDDIGPATIGLRPARVLVPRMVLDLEEPLRRLVLRHEREHCEARDPWLLLAAAIAVVLFPWNPALWLMRRRIRLVIELDCDARMLDGDADTLRYGRLLLMLAQRHRPIAFAPMLAASSSNLERRIIAMRTRLVAPRPMHLALAAATLAIGLVGACSAGAPDAPAKGQHPAASRTPTHATAPYFEFQVEKVVKQVPSPGVLRYPDAMRSANREGEVLAQFVVDEQGVADMSTFKALESTDAAFTDAVRTALPAMRFTPAEIGGHPVKQVVQQPFTFSLKRN